MTTNHTPEPSPETSPVPTPQPTPPAAPPIAPQPSVGAQPAAGTPPKKPYWRRTPVVGVAAAVALLLVGGVGGALLVDELRDDRGWESSRGGWDDRDRDDRDRWDSYQGDARGPESRTSDDPSGAGADGATGTGGSAEAAGTQGTVTAPERDRSRLDDDTPLTDAELAAVTEAAQAEAGGGTVTDVDRSDDRSHAFEADVLLADGDELEVYLDEDFVVLRTQLDRARD